MTHAIGYVRVSTALQDLGPDAQRAAILAYAKQHGLAVASFHDDLGVSGATPVPDRPGLMAALGALKACGKGSVLVVAKRDRLARSLLVGAQAEALAKRVGCSIVSADGAGAGTGPEAELMRNLLDSFAQFERAIIAARTKAALSVRRSKGLRISGACPYGFAFSTDGRLVPAPLEQRIVDRALTLHASGLAAYSIAAQLEAEGVRGRNGRPLTRATVSRWLCRTPTLSAPLAPVSVSA